MFFLTTQSESFNYFKEVNPVGLSELSFTELVSGYVTIFWNQYLSNSIYHISLYISKKLRLRQIRTEQ